MKIIKEKLEEITKANAPSRVMELLVKPLENVVDSLQSQLEQVTKERDDCKERLENLRDNSSRTINHYTDRTISLKEKLTKAKSQLKEAEKVFSRVDNIKCIYKQTCDHPDIKDGCVSCYTREATRQYFKEKAYKTYEHTKSEYENENN